MHVIGFAKLIGELIDGLVKVMIFFGVAALIATAIIYAYTRCVRSTALVIACSLVAVVWQLGLVALLGFELDPFSILVPFLVFAIGVSHGAQKMNGIMQDIGRGTHKLVAARYTFRRLFLAGLTALLADAVGFARADGDRHPGDPGSGAHRQHRRRRADLHQPAAAAGAAVVHRGQRSGGASAACKEEREETRGRGLGKLWLFLDRFTTRRWAIGAIAVSAVLAVVRLRRQPQARRSATSIRARRSCARTRATTATTRTSPNNYALSSDQFAVIVKTDTRRVPQVRDAGRGRPPGAGRCARCRACRPRCRSPTRCARSPPARSRAARSG